MSTLNPDLLQEGNGIYGWDLINPYLQEWYRKKENGENEESPAFIAPLPGENSVVPFPSIPKQETPIPLKPDYPINPRTGNPDRNTSQIKVFNRRNKSSGRTYLERSKIFPRIHTRQTI